LSDPLSADLLDRVLARLGLSAPRAPDRDGLRAVYGAWCEGVPFDNLRKRSHVHRSDPGVLPGDLASDFFEGWLETGAGGTCWAGNNALQALLVGLGFDARRAVGAMLVVPMPDPEPSHGTVVVHLAGERLLVDASMLHGAPLALEDESATRLDGPGWGVCARREKGSFHVTWHPGGGDPFDCRILAFDSDRDEFHARHERSRSWSPFNQQLSCRVVRGDRVIGIGMGHGFEIDATGRAHRRPLDDEARLRFLIEEANIDEAFASTLPPDEPMGGPPGG